MPRLTSFFNLTLIVFAIWCLLMLSKASYQHFNEQGPSVIGIRPHLSPTQYLAHK